MKKRIVFLALVAVLLVVTIAIVGYNQFQETESNEQVTIQTVDQPIAPSNTNEDNSAAQDIEVSADVTQWLANITYDENIQITAVLSEHIAISDDAVYLRTFTRAEDDTITYYLEEVTGVDPDTLEVLKDDASSIIMKDSDTAYFGRIDTIVPLDEIDVDSLRVEPVEGVDYLEAYDDTFYIFGASFDQEYEYLLAEKSSYKKLNEWFYRDANNVFIPHYSVLERIDLIDVESMELIDEYYITDANGVYGLMVHWEWATVEKLEGANPDTFEVLSRFLTTDREKVYYNTRLVSDFEVDAQTVQAIETDERNLLYADKNALYYFFGNSGIRIDDVDIDSVESINKVYPGMYQPIWRDKNGLYTIVSSAESELSGHYDLSVAKINVDVDSVTNFYDIECSELEFDAVVDYSDFCIVFEDKNGTHVMKRGERTVEKGFLYIESINEKE